MTRSSSKDLACAIRFPLPSSAIDEPSKMRLSLPPTWLHISTGMPSRRAMAASIWRRSARLECQKGEEERLMWRLGFLAHELFHGIHLVEPPRPEVLVVPGVLADGDGQPLAVQLHHLLRPAGRKVALLVEDVVEGQQPLVLLEEHAAAIDEDRRPSHAGFAGPARRPRRAAPRLPARPWAARAWRRPVHRQQRGNAQESSAFPADRREDSRR